MLICSSRFFTGPRDRRPTCDNVARIGPVISSEIESLARCDPCRTTMSSRSIESAKPSSFWRKCSGLTAGSPPRGRRRPCRVPKSIVNFRIPPGDPESQKIVHWSDGTTALFQLAPGPCRRGAGWPRPWAPGQLERVLSSWSKAASTLACSARETCRDGPEQGATYRGVEMVRKARGSRCGLE
jgi:hypothetical protein